MYAILELIKWTFFFFFKSDSNLNIKKQKNCKQSVKNAKMM